MAASNQQTVPQTQYNMGYVWAISLVAAMGGLMFGYDWVVIGGTKPFYERFFSVATAWQEGWAMASALVGCLLGAIVSGSLSDKFGRKWLLVLAAFVFLVSSLGTGLIHTFWAFNLWRIAGGMAIGLASNLSPMYIAEVAPAAVRGRLVTMYQFTVVIGILAAQVVNLGVANYGSSADTKAVTAQIAKTGAAFDAKKVAEDLAWQVPCQQREKLVADFVQLASGHAGTFDFKTIELTVKELNAKRKTEKLAQEITAHESEATVVGHGVVPWSVNFGWRWMFGITALPALLFFLFVLFVPESPRWLVKNGKSERARAVLARIGGMQYADTEVANVQQTLVGEIEKVNFRDLLEPRMFKILLIGVTFAVLQQWCGINVIFYYATDIFKAAGASVDDALWNIVRIGAVNVLFTVVAIYFVDRVGRRILMLIGFAGLTIILSLIGGSFFWAYSGMVVLWLALATIGCFAMSLGPVVWVILSEMFPNRIRGAAMSVSVFSLWTACFLLTFTFPILNENLGTAGTFWIYAAICLFGLVFTFFKLPETKGKTLEEIERQLVD
jgi:MFS family permease